MQTLDDRHPTPEYVSGEVVLDTNVVLDWLVFGDPAACAIGAAIAAGHCRWIATRPMIDELTEVLQRTMFDRWRGSVMQHALTSTTSLCIMVETDLPQPAALRCRDPDDQKFVDLALARGARHLYTRDKALLALAGRAALLGVGILRPIDASGRTAEKQRAAEAAR